MAKKGRLTNTKSLPNHLKQNRMNNSSVNQKNQKNGTGQTKNENPIITQERNEAQISAFEMSSTPNRKEQQMIQSFSPVNPSLENSNNQDLIGQTDSKISIKKNNEYLKFYKFYFERLKKQHSNWTTKQLTKIISLQWKNKKIMKKKSSVYQPSVITQRRSTKLMTAKDAFKRRNKQMGKLKIEQLWASLPQQSKTFWKKQGQNYGNKINISDINSMKQSKTSDINSVKQLKILSFSYNPMKSLLNNN